MLLSILTRQVLLTHEHKTVCTFALAAWLGMRPGPRFAHSLHAALCVAMPQESTGLFIETSRTSSKVLSYRVSDLAIALCAAAGAHAAGGEGAGGARGGGTAA